MQRLISCFLILIILLFGCNKPKSDKININDISDSVEKMNIMNKEDFEKLDSMNENALRAKYFSCGEIKWAISIQSKLSNKYQFKTSGDVLRANKISEFIRHIRNTPESCRNEIYNYANDQFVEGMKSNNQNLLRNCAGLFGVSEDPRSISALKTLSKSSFDNVSSQAVKSIEKINNENRR